MHGPPLVCWMSLWDGGVRDMICSLGFLGEPGASNSQLGATELKQSPKIRTSGPAVDSSGKFFPHTFALLHFINTSPQALSPQRDHLWSPLGNTPLFQPLSVTHFSYSTSYMWPDWLVALLVLQNIQSTRAGIGEIGCVYHSILAPPVWCLGQNQKAVLEWTEK